jgi:putative DNA primase/helicase
LTADLAGKRLVVASETEQGKRLRVQFVKESTGDATLRGRFMRQDYFEFRRTHKTILCTNAKPVVRDDSIAIWRRIKLIPFTVQIPEEEQDKKLIQKLKAEWPGILAWMVEGCLKWQRDGLHDPPNVTEATATYRNEQDVLEPFLADRCLWGDKLQVSRRALYGAYTQWATGEGEKYALSRNALYDGLRQRGAEDCEFTEGGRTARGFKNIGVRSC